MNAQVLKNYYLFHLKNKFTFLNMNFYLNQEKLKANF